MPGAVHGKAIRPEILRSGGRVVIVPFSAGPDVSASDELNQAALVMIRGMMDGFDARDGRFQVVDQRWEGRPDLLITGRVERFEIEGKWKRYFGGSRRRRLQVSGRVVDGGGELVAAFSYDVSARYQDVSQVDFLLKAGRAVADFLSR